VQHSTSVVVLLKDLSAWVVFNAKALFGTVLELGRPVQLPIAVIFVDDAVRDSTRAMNDRTVLPAHFAGLFIVVAVIDREQPVLDIGNDLCDLFHPARSIIIHCVKTFLWRCSRCLYDHSEAKLVPAR